MKTQSAFPFSMLAILIWIGSVCMGCPKTMADAAPSSAGAMSCCCHKTGQTSCPMCAQSACCANARVSCNCTIVPPQGNRTASTEIAPATPPAFSGVVIDAADVRSAFVPSADLFPPADSDHDVSSALPVAELIQILCESAPIVSSIFSQSLTGFESCIN
jgi:hypothetical protein